MFDLFTPEFVDRLVRMRAQGATVRQAAALCGISEASYYEYMKVHPDTKQQIENLRGTLRFAAEEVISEAITQGRSVSVAQWYLRHRHSDRYNTKGEAPEPENARHDRLLQQLGLLPEQSLPDDADAL